MPSPASPTAAWRIWRGACWRPFPAASRRGCSAQVVGNPVRREIVELPPPAQRFALRDGADPRAGARRQPGCCAPECDRAVRARARGAAASSTCATRPASAGSHSAQRNYAQAGVSAQLHAFIDEMAEAYGWADLVICRAGALTISELAAAGVGSVLVPFPAATDDHQTRNAAALVAEGAALMIAERELSARAAGRDADGLCGGRGSCSRWPSARGCSPSPARHRSWPTPASSWRCSAGRDSGTGSAHEPAAIAAHGLRAGHAMPRTPARACVASRPFTSSASAARA